MFHQLRLGGWRQFDRVDIAFHPKLTILTGANGAGKTTILNLLGHHFGWNVPLTRHPQRSRRRQAMDHLDEHWLTPLDQTSPVPADAVGLVRYTDGNTSYLVEPSGEGVQFNLALQPTRGLRGVHIASHRPVPGRAQVQHIPANPPTKANAVQNYQQEVLRRYLGQGSQKTPGHVLKETLMSLCLVGEGTLRVAQQPELAETLIGFESILRLLLPATFRFERFQVELPELYLISNGLSVPFDAVSGGIASLIDIAYQIYMYSPPGEPYVTVIDEPENHLHPALQRQFLPDLIGAFPDVQFIIASHNPFIITSQSDSSVYALVVEDGRVTSEFLDVTSRAGPASEVLREVLGLESTLPIWVERAMDTIIERHLDQPISPASITALREALIAAGLDNFVVEALAEYGTRATDG